jgi:hypothetical protein
MSQDQVERWHRDLQDLFGLSIQPIGIAFMSAIPAGIDRIQRSMPPPSADGRTGAVPATTAEDHGNCSVGALTHGFKTMQGIAHNADVKALCESGWITAEAAARMAAVHEQPKTIVYGPLRNMPAELSVILLRLNGKQQMLLHDAWPGVRFEGKPQCHIIPIAKERQFCRDLREPFGRGDGSAKRPISQRGRRSARAGIVPDLNLKGIASEDGQNAMRNKFLTRASEG